jgi:hypothetical protein
MEVAMDPVLYYAGYTGGYFEFNGLGAVTKEAAIVDPRSGIPPTSALFQPPPSQPSLSFENTLRSQGCRIDRITIYYSPTGVAGIMVEYEDKNDNPYGWHLLGSNTAPSTVQFPFSKGEFLSRVEGIYKMDAQAREVNVGGRMVCRKAIDAQWIALLTLNRTKTFPPGTAMTDKTHFRFEAPFGYQIIGFWGGLEGSVIRTLGVIMKLRDGARIEGLPPMTVVGGLPVIELTSL